MVAYRPIAVIHNLYPFHTQSSKLHVIKWTTDFYSVFSDSNPYLINIILRSVLK